MQLGAHMLSLPSPNLESRTPTDWCTPTGWCASYLLSSACQGPPPLPVPAPRPSPPV